MAVPGLGAVCGLSPVAGSRSSSPGAALRLLSVACLAAEHGL